MPKKCYIENEGNATLSMDDIYYYSINNSLLLANVLFGNYRLPIKIYYICSHTVDKKKFPAVGTVFAVAVGCFCFLVKALKVFFLLWTLGGEDGHPSV